MTTETWTKLSKTDPKYTKGVDGKGFKATAINPTYTYEKMTGLFGPCGVGWKVEVVKTETIPAPDGQILLFREVNVYTKQGKEWSEPIPGVGGDFIIRKTKNGLISDDDAYKKATTDAIGNALKFLGMSADVHMGLYDDNKYVAELKEQFPDTPKEFTREDRIFQRDFVYGLSKQKTTKDVELFHDAWRDDLEENKHISDILLDAVESRKIGITNKVTFHPTTFEFVDVQEAIEFSKLAAEKLDKLKAGKLEAGDMYVWVEENQHKLEAIDRKLTAAKYIVDGKKPYERFKAAYNSTQQQAAE